MIPWAVNEHVNEGAVMLINLTDDELVGYAWACEAMQESISEQLTQHEQQLRGTSFRANEMAWRAS
jgi:hypothetical protein